MIIKSEKKNSYCLNSNIPQIIFIHPILEYLIDLRKKGFDLGKWVNEFEGNSLFLNGRKFSVLKSEIIYYYKYFQFLEKNNYFKEIRKVSLNDTRKYSEREIEFRIANTEQIVLEVTNECNLKCRYCGYGDFYSGFETRTGEMMDIKTAYAIIDYIISLKKKYLSYIKTHKKFAISFYGGEPLLNFKLIKEVVEYVKKINLPHFEFLFSMTTNGVLLEKHIEFLAENGFLLLISLDGDRESNVHRIFKNEKESFQFVLNNIKMLQKKMPSYFKESVQFISVMHNKNFLRKIDDFFKKNFDKTPIALSLSQVGLREDKQEEFNSMLKEFNSNSEIEEKKSYFEKLKNSDLPNIKHLEDFIKSYSGFVFARITDFLKKSYESEITSTGTCHPFEKKVFVTVNGKLLPCERIMQNFYMGEIIDCKVQLDFQKISEKYNAYYNKLSKMCDICYNSKICNLCIFHLNLNDEKVICEHFKNKEDFLKNASKTISLLEKTPGYYFQIMKKMENIGSIT